jgi:hypothetical protein
MPAQKHAFEAGTVGDRPLGLLVWRAEINDARRIIAAPRSALPPESGPPSGMALEPMEDIRQEYTAEEIVARLRQVDLLTLQDRPSPSPGIAKPRSFKHRAKLREFFTIASAYA